MSSKLRSALGRAALLLGVALGSGACGPEPPQGPYAVVEREFTWSAAGGDDALATRAPLSSSWDFGVSQPEWSVTSGTGTTADGALTLAGAGKVGIAGPGDGAVDDEMVHWLTVRLRTTTAKSLELSRRGGVPRSQPLAGSGELETITIALASLERVITREDAPELTLTAVGASGQPVEVRLEHVGLVSDYDSAGSQGFIEAPLVRLGVRRRGVALRTPGTVALAVPAAAGDRLRFALALLGAEQPLDVVLTEAAGRVAEQRFRCEPGAAWAEHAVALPDEPDDGSWSFAFHVAAPPDSRAVVLIGSPLLLRRAAGPAPRVVLYVEDTLRADHLQTLGYARPTDPHLGAIAAAGQAFTRAWSSSNWTRPAVSSLLTGLDPVGHANIGNEWRVADELVTLTEALAAAGCVTGSFVTNHHGGSWSGLDQGFDVHGDPAAFDASALTSTLTSALIADPIASFLAEHADESFFVYAHSLDPHAPYQADGQSLEELASARLDPALAADNPEVGKRIVSSLVHYDAEIRHNDRELAALDAALAARGLTQDTLLVFVADHGEAFFDHGQWEHRHTLHEEEVRVPWILRWPARLPAGVRHEAPASLVDVAPTMLGLLGLPVPPAWRGRDLSALCLEPGRRLPPTPVFVYTLDDPPQPGRIGQVALIAWPDKLVADLAQNGAITASALYRLDDDPAESTDLLPEAGAGSPRVAAMLGEIRARLDAGPVSAAGAARAEDMSSEIESWMRAMGYLR